MGKNTFFTGQPIFTQLISLMPRSLIQSVSKEFKTDHYCKSFKGYDHLITMLYCSFHQCTSIREVTTGMQASAHRLLHLGLQRTPRRSTLSDANKRRDSNYFQTIFHKLYAHHFGFLPDSRKKKNGLIDKLFIIDSTTISLFTDVMRSTGSFSLNGKKKGGAKAHMVVSAKNDLPCFVRITEGKVSDTKFLQLIDLPKGSIIVMDKGYRNYQKLIEWTEKEIEWVTRLHGRAVWEVQQDLEVNQRQKALGVISDSVINLGNPRTVSINPLQTVRLVTFFDKKSKRSFQFISNKFNCSPATIANLYKKRWQIELLFKRLKQNYPLHSFLGDNENAIKIQIWCSLIADLLLKVIKDRVEKKGQRKWSFANLASLIRIHLSTYINVMAFLLNPEKSLIGYGSKSTNQQLPLFEKGAYF